MFWVRNEENSFPVRILIWRPDYRPGNKVGGDKGEIVALGAEISPKMGPREKLESL